MKWNKERSRIIKTALLLIFAVCLILIGREYFSSRQHREQHKALQEQLAVQSEPQHALQETAVSDSVPSESQEMTDTAAGEPDNEEPVILEKYADLFTDNNDLAGGTNVIVYGHNMKDGSMFGDLDLYQSADFCREHPTLSFDTPCKEHMYENIAVFRSQVYNADKDVFKYYQFYEAQTQEEFDDFYQNIKAMSLYDTGVTAQFGDAFLILSTCACHVTDRRFVVVAKQCRVLTESDWSMNIG